MLPGAFDLKPLFTKSTQTRRPIIAVVAGSGQVAQYAQESGADLLIALSAGVFRNLGAGQFTDATLQAIAETRPANRRELAGLPGVGARKLELYGDDVLATVSG